MNTPDRTIDIGGKSYTLRFGQNALFKLEQRIHEMEEKMVGQGIKESAALKGLELLGTLPNNMAMHLMFWAGLEGGRVKDKRLQPYSMDEVGEMIDVAGGIVAVMATTMLAFSEAFPGKFSKAYLENIAKLEEARKNGPPAPESAPVPESPTIPRRGKNASAKGSKRASPSTGSGG